MSDENQTSAGSITSMEVVAVRIVCEAPEPAYTLDSPPDLTGARLMQTERPPQTTVSEGQKAQSIGTCQIGLPMDKASAAWTGELKAPNRHEALSSLVRRDRGGLRIGLVAGILAGTLGLGWWTGLLDPRLNFDPASTPPRQIALADRAVPDVDKPTISEPPANQVSTPAESSSISTPAETSNVSTPAESSSRGIDDASAPHGDRGSVTPTDFAPTTAQKATAMKPAVAPQRTQERHARNRPRPVPETRPTTIEGWTVRSVSGGTAVLQGPDGIRRVSVGETVPGAGRIDSIVRWGNRWIVATSRGLISTD
jgi:hypothetical protein